MATRILTLLFVLLAIALPAVENLAPNGDMEQGSERGVAHWGGEWEADEANRFLRFRVEEPGQVVSAYREIALGAAEALELSVRVRYQGVQRGSEAWHDARIILDFKDAEGNKVGSAGAPYFTGSSEGWREITRRFRVPEGATRLAVMPGIFHAKAGTFDLDDLRVTPIDPALVQLRQTEAAVVVDAGGEPPSALRVEGKDLVDASGKPVWLQGLSVPSLEWTPSGERVLQSIVVGIEDWRAGIIRLPVKAKYWFGQDKHQKDGGQDYRALVDAAILAASSRGCYLVLDLHHYKAAKDADIAFWEDAAARYAGNPAVLFGLLNEPHGISWEVWRNGGDLPLKGGSSDALAENQEEQAETWHSPGMQAMVDAVRATGADNVLVIGGLDWAYDLSGILDGYAISDPEGRGVVYDTHVYPWKSGWQEKFLEVAKHHPVLVGEVGADRKRYDFIPPERFESPYTWAPDMLGVIQEHRLHWTAWAFHPSCGPAILSGWDYEPNGYWGAYVRSALLGARFKTKRMR